MSDFWLYLFQTISILSFLGSCLFLIQLLSPPKAEGGVIVIAIAAILFSSFLNRIAYNERNKINDLKEYEVIHEVQVETKDNIDTITYRLNDSTFKVVNLNEYFGRKFTDETILVKRVKAGIYAGWKVSAGKKLLFEIKETDD